MSEDETLDRVVELLRQARKVTVLTGAGVSAESGVPTFRASDGLWEGHRIEDVATPTGFAKNPELVWQFYNARRANVGKVQPNPGHHALVQLEERYKQGFTLVTQNVDGLHRAAGSRSVYEIHGSLYRTRCLDCGKLEDRGLEPLGHRPKCPSCSGYLRPDIVWFHESLPVDIWEAAQHAAHECDVLLVVGTSAVVYPAANLIPIAKGDRGMKPEPGIVIEFNLTRTEASPLADFGIYGPSGVMLPKLVERLGSS
jgi:NAD-dependent deacetylase